MNSNITLNFDVQTPHPRFSMPNISLFVRTPPAPERPKKRPGTSEVNRTLYLDPSSTPKSQNGRAMLKQRRARSVSSSGSMDHATSENVLSPSMKQHHRRRSGGSVPGNGTGAGFATAVDATSSSVSSSRVSSRNPSPASSGSWRRVGGWVGGGGGGIITPRASSLGSSSAGGFGSASKVKSPLSSSRLSADGVFVASRVSVCMLYLIRCGPFSPSILLSTSEYVVYR